MRRDSGFTLIELLVVILIIGIIASVALLATGDFGRSRRIDANLDEFKQVITYAEEQAIVQAATYGVYINSIGYQFNRYQLNGNHAHWYYISNDPILKSYLWPADTTVFGINPNDKNPAIVINQDGSITPFNLALDIETHHYRIIGYANGTIEILKSG